MDVAPAMGLPVLLLSPTAAAHQYVPTDTGRQLRPHCRGPDLDRHNGRNLANATGWKVPWGVLHNDLLPCQETGVRTTPTARAI